MEKRNNIIMKCCVCQRIKTDAGWNYQFVMMDGDNVISHGYCPVCYQEEVEKISGVPMTGSGVLSLAR